MEAGADEDDCVLANACNAIERNDPYTRGIVVLGLDAPQAELEESFQLAAGFDLVKGFAVGRTIFGDAARKWLAGSLSECRCRGGYGRALPEPVRSGTRRGRGGFRQGRKSMKTIRLTAAQAMVRYLANQLNEDGVPYIAGMWAIFGHGNVAGIGEALYGIREELPTYRGQNEQSMAHAAIAYAKQLVAAAPWR